MYLPIDGGLFIAFLVIFASLVLFKIRQAPIRTKEAQTGSLKLIFDAPDAELELILVHGLAADPEWTWIQVFPNDTAGNGPDATAKDKTSLHDLLRARFPKSRILSFSDNSTHLGTESVMKTTEEIGRSFLTEIKAQRRQPSLPLVFIGHSMGGIVLKQALCTIGSKRVLEDTCGIVFLGTPHQGSYLSWLGSIVSFLTQPWGSDTTLVMSLSVGNPELSNLRRKFEDILEKQSRRPHITSFYETQATFLGGLSAGVIVPRDSATVHAKEEVYIDTDHSGLNKCFGANTKLFDLLAKSIHSSKLPSRLEQVDEILRTQYGSGHNDESKYEKLNIVRLSGKTLPMGNCYINLCIVEYHGSESTARPKTSANISSSLSSRKAADDVDKESLVDLGDIFDERKGPDGKLISPRRILIRGRAGVGKTTLCKKMVHGFLDRGMWKSMFDRVLWIPLRNLKGRQGSGYNLKKLFNDEFFSQRQDGNMLAHQLWEVLGHHPGKTLFILDGMDEVSQLLGGDGDMAKCLDKLLQQHSVIVTSRPNVSLPLGVTVDFELETIGFSQEQVETYLKADPEYIPRADEIQSLLQRNWLLRSLVRIPIQLDALCFIWEEIDIDKAPETMTGIYNEIVQKLWTKDLTRIGKGSPGDAPPTKTEIEIETENETALLEYLAFNGLYNDTIDFSKDDRDEALSHMARGNSEFKLGSRVDDLLAKLSFMRSSDPSQPRNTQTFHFIHLTYQEYFAARWFKRCWEKNQPLCFHFFSDPQSKSVDDFAGQHKYTTKFNIMWRFVSGLCDLETYGRRTADDLFSLLGKEPVDLFGATHHQLLVHCLAEVVKSVDVRTVVEDQLFRWLEFEFNIINQSRMIREAEFPERTLTLFFQQSSDKTKYAFLIACMKNAIRTQVLLMSITQWLKDPGLTSIIRNGIFRVLHHYESLTTDLMDSMICHMDGTDMEIGHGAATVLRRQRVFPSPIKSRLLSRLSSPYQNRREQAVFALQGLSDIPPAILAWLGDCSESVKMEGIGALVHRSKLPESAYQAVANLVGCENSKDIRMAALRTFLNKENLSDDVLNVIVAQIQDPTRDIVEQAIACLKRQPTLPQDLLQAIITFLSDEDNFNLYSDHVGFQTGLRLHEERRSGDSPWDPPRSLQGDIVEAALATLGHDDATYRNEAVRLLKRLSPIPDDTCQSMQKQLNELEIDVDFDIFLFHTDLSLRVKMALLEQAETGGEVVKTIAKTVLCNNGPLSLQQLDTVVQWLGDPDESVSEMAMRIMALQVVDPEEVLGMIASGLQYEAQDIKIMTLRRLKAIAYVFPIPEDIKYDVAAQLVLTDPAIEEATVDTLHVFSHNKGLSPEVIIRVAAKLDSNRAELKIKILDLLWQQSQKFQEPVLREILSKINDDDDKVRELALGLLSLERNGVLPPDFYSKIADHVNDLDDKCESRALEALPLEFELPRSTLNGYKMLFNHRSWVLRWHALQKLEDRPALPPDVLHKVKIKLRDSEDIVRQAAARVFRGQKVSCPEIMLELARTLNDDDSDTSSTVADVLCSQSKLDEKTFVAILNVAKGSTKGRKTAMPVLRKHSPLDPKFLQDIVNLMDDENKEVRRDALHTLGADKSLPEDILLKVTAMIRDEDSDVKQTAYHAVKHQLVLPDTIVKSEKMYRLWLAESSERDVCCYVEGRTIYLNLPFNMGRVQLKGNPDIFKAEIQQLRNKLGCPSLLTAVQSRQ